MQNSSNTMKNKFKFCCYEVSVSLSSLTGTTKKMKEIKMVKLMDLCST